MTKEQQRTLEIALCNYIPYGVKYKYFCPYDHENDRIGTIEGVDHLPKLYLFDENGYRVQLCKTAMLLLHPLSDLTKEITHNGESFVPMKELAAMCVGGFNSVAKAIEMVPVSLWPMWIIDKLTEWLFDYRGLINSGLAISIHDLPENPY